MRCVKTKKKSRLIRVRVSRVVGKRVENYHLWNFRFWIAFSQSARRDERHVNQNSIHFLAALRGNQRQQQQATCQIAQNTQSLKRQQLALIIVYQILWRSGIHSGAFSNVYKAIDFKTGKKVAGGFAHSFAG